MKRWLLVLLPPPPALPTHLAPEQVEHVRRGRAVQPQLQGLVRSKALLAAEAPDHLQRCGNADGRAQVRERASESVPARDGIRRGQRGAPREAGAHALRLYLGTAALPPQGRTPPTRLPAGPPPPPAPAPHPYLHELVRDVQHDGALARGVALGKGARAAHAGHVLLQHAGHQPAHAA